MRIPVNGFEQILVAAQKSFPELDTVKDASESHGSAAAGDQTSEIVAGKSCAEQSLDFRLKGFLRVGDENCWTSED